MTVQGRRRDDEEPRPVTVPGDGVELAAVEWEGEGPLVLLAHATGFHARVWDEVARALPGRHVLAVDARGHGRSPVPEGPWTWDRFGRDMEAVLAGLDGGGVVGVGHSMGGHSVTWAAGRAPQRVAALVLVDPTIRRVASWRRTEGGGPADFVARRRNRFASAEEMVERFRDRPPYATWRPQVLEDYARHGLRPDPDGDGLVLACPPAVEAAIYAGGGATDVFDVVPAIDVPVRVLRARQPEPGVEVPPFSTSPTDPDLAAAFPRAEDVLLADRSHFFPMEDPDLVAAHVEDVCRRVEGRPPDR